MQLKIKYEAVNVGRLIKSAGRKGNSKQKVWESPYAEALSLGLEYKIVSNGEKNVQ